MDWLPLIALSAVVFASTNIDDIVLLAVFFADATMKRSAIIVGQFLGIAVLTGVSAVAGAAALAVPEGWTSLLGVVPLGLGIWKLIALIRRRGEDADDEAATRSDKAQWLTVASVTIANGADNLGVYIPLFASDPRSIPVHAITFAILTAVWLLLGYGLVKNRLIGERIGKYGHVALPFVLIILGSHILWDFVAPRIG